MSESTVLAVPRPRAAVAAAPAAPAAPGLTTARGAALYIGALLGPGLLLLHSPGNAFIRDLRPGESLLIQPSSLLYRDITVNMHLHLEYPRNMGFAFWHSRWSYRSIWARLHGPGRVAVQSIYAPPEDTEMITSHSYATTHHW